MTAQRRLGLVAILSLAFMVTMTCRSIVEQLAGDVLREEFPGHWFSQPGSPGAGSSIINNQPLVAQALGRAVMLALWLWPLCFWQGLRDLGTLRLPRSATVFLVLPYPLLALCFFGGWPAAPVWPKVICMAWIGMAIGVVEELVYRGFAFRRSPQTHPRLVVLLSALFFSAQHLWHLAVVPPGQVLPQVLSTFSFGVGFGIVRLASGSLGWCMLMHGLMNAAGAFAADSEIFQKSYLTVLTHCSVATAIVFWRHPALQRPKLRSPE
jgi:membrane protease YdiL (CAAX protease family)